MLFVCVLNLHLRTTWHIFSVMSSSELFWGFISVSLWPFPGLIKILVLYFQHETGWRHFPPVNAKENSPPTDWFRPEASNLFPASSYLSEMKSNLYAVTFNLMQYIDSNSNYLFFPERSEYISNRSSHFRSEHHKQSSSCLLYYLVLLLYYWFEIRMLLPKVNTYC